MASIAAILVGGFSLKISSQTSPGNLDDLLDHHDFNSQDSMRSPAIEVDGAARCNTTRGMDAFREAN